MQSRLTLVLLLGLTATVIGCVESSTNDYVNFDQTAPSTLDQRKVDNDVAANTEAAPPSLDVKPVSAVSESDSADVNHAVSNQAADPDEPGDAGDQPKLPATVAGSTVASSVLPSEPVAGPSESSGAVVPAAASISEIVAPATGVDSSGTQIVSNQSGLTGPADNPLIENAVASEPREIELLIPEKTFRKERGSSALRLSYDDLDLLKILNMEPVPIDAAEYFPEWLKALDGKPIRIRGFMYPTFEATGLTAFTLARDNGICCFVRQPKIYDIIAISLADGVTSDYIEGRPFDVEGVLHIEPQADEKDLYRLYRIENARVLR